MADKHKDSTEKAQESEAKTEAAARPEKADAETPKAKAADKGELAYTVFVTDPETQDTVSAGPGGYDENARKFGKFTFNGEYVDELPQWVLDAITNPNAWVKSK